MYNYYEHSVNSCENMTGNEILLDAPLEPSHSNIGLPEEKKKGRTKDVKMNTT